MPEILVTAAQVKAKAEELRTMNEQFKSMVSELESQEVDLNSMWEGQANDAFHNAFMRDKSQMENSHSVMTMYISTLEQIAAEYEKAEAQNMMIGNTRSY